ncbi:DUF485 domain-containing protein [Metabacillus sp. GX 13764]|uniref:DUF485 domain-containing protein n=1 Tax=Metabacillus kandeliae TaxID=2900151 RepID=UPI001E56B202|nr:DUF485 domain-containing protein [Metabacillus kandeliae]MCD7035135.1 DUF485 domain-containing protein [Metabacillus kandeliae]
MKEKPTVDYSAIAQSQSFKTLLSKKRRFILPASLFFLIFYFALPVMTSYFTFLNHPAIGPVSWAWIFAFAQFIMTWVLCTLYSKKAAEFDKIVEGIAAEAGGSREVS